MAFQEALLEFLAALLIVVNGKLSRYIIPVPPILRPSKRESPSFQSCVPTWVPSVLSSFLTSPTSSIAPKATCFKFSTSCAFQAWFASLPPAWSLHCHGIRWLSDMMRHLSMKSRSQDPSTEFQRADSWVLENVFKCWGRGSPSGETVIPSSKFYLYLFIYF